MQAQFVEKDHGLSTAGRMILEAEKVRIEHNKKVQEEGGTFNIFEISHVARKEVGTHSNMLYSILNPKSEHTMGGLYLELFIKHIGFSSISDDSWGIEREKNTPNGRIDFWLSSRKHHICFAVEMKIDAADQEKQLYRYDAYAKSMTSDGHNVKEIFNDYRVLYLTLDGHAASRQSIHTMDESKLVYVSFKKEIVNWLNECILLTQSTKNVFSAMMQYRNLIEKLVEEEKQMELVKLLHSKEHYMALKELQRAEIELKKEFVTEFWKLLLETLPEGFEYAKGVSMPQDFYTSKSDVCLHYKTSQTLVCNDIIYNYYVCISAFYGKDECLWTGIYLYNAEKDRCPKVKSKAPQLLEKLKLNNYFEHGYSDDYYLCCLGSNYIYSKNEDYYQFNDFSQPVINMLDNPSDDINHIASQVEELMNIIEPQIV